MVHKREPLGIDIKIQKHKKEEKILQEIVPKTKKRSKGKLETKKTNLNTCKIQKKKYKMQGKEKIKAMKKKSNKNKMEE